MPRGLLESVLQEIQTVDGKNKDQKAEKGEGPMTDITKEQILKQGLARSLSYIAPPKKKAQLTPKEVKAQKIHDLAIKIDGIDSGNLLKLMDAITELPVSTMKSPQDGIAEAIRKANGGSGYDRSWVNANPLLMMSGSRYSYMFIGKDGYCLKIDRTGGNRAEVNDMRSKSGMELSSKDDIQWVYKEKAGEIATYVAAGLFS